ncbi:MAG TPA: FlgT C-terminal domain-containing protein [Phycisphaerales bacterium]|nr:FlgT C-terminal domain-containing protein [Phycisphaerales bacterium]
MAARTSTSVGVGATITILAVATLGLFVTSMIFYAKAREATLLKEGVEKTTRDFVSDIDRNDPVVIRIKEVAKPGTPAGKTVLGYVMNERKDLMQKVTGSDRDTIEAVNRILDAAKGTNLVGVIRDRDNTISNLTKRVEDAEADRTRALQDKETESKRVKSIEENQRATVAALQAEVDKTKAETDALREGIAVLKAQMDTRVDDISAGCESRVAALKSDIDKLQAERAVNQGRLRQFEEQQRGSRFVGQSEYALIDGQVVVTNGSEGTVTLNIGRKQHVVLGLPFTVYSQGTVIRLDDKTNDYPAGKATLEVIRVEENSSIARIIREQKGNPVVKGDVVANPMYDPAKQYKFLVYGNFDPQRTGNASAFGANEVKAWIQDWGGETVDKLSGDVDFIVLGERPQIPPQPSSSAPIEVINFNLDQQRAAQRYDDLLKQATDTAIPVLNENRLRTLLGR